MNLFSWFRRSKPRVRILRADDSLRVQIVDPPHRPGPSKLRGEIDRVWADECRKNPRLHDGPILSVVSIDIDAGLIHCIRDSYKHLVAAQSGLATGTRMLGVKGVLITDNNRVLIGQRGTQTRMYPGLEEFAPAGGVRPPQQPHVRTLGPAELAAELLNEAREELDAWFAPNTSVLNPAPWRVLGLCEDDAACSVDVVIGVDVPPSSITDLNASGSWEYSHGRWCDLDHLRQDLIRDESVYSPPTHAIYWKLVNSRR